GTYSLTFRASDGMDEVFKEVDIKVYNVNRAPVVASAEPKKSITVKRNEKIKFRIEANDPDGDEVSYLWKFSLLEHYRKSNVIARTFTTAGQKKVKAVVSDGRDETEYEWDVKVV
ncbi:PKD domain-containing protein, partial [Candidatus Woesearchaeota archaeon]|nr:PKD domain-containing protein [Candidatus Woesearchaeota archaeon]